MDYLDIMIGRFNGTFSGTYFPTEVPRTVLREELANIDTLGVVFDYEIADSYAWEVRKLLPNIVDFGTSTVTIRTNNGNNFTVGKHVLLQDGNLYTINYIARDFSKVSREAAEIGIVPLGAEWLLQLIQIENPWGVA